ncbi:MAG: 4a-hydroxytetrahydrobiopterin dehydratase [Candidatus Gracilibacteria bacterium]|nr:4a-hydroxytetrahydrobiopterin dehydratase [Candidatus Gracilibacteria bacterium]
MRFTEKDGKLNKIYEFKNFLEAIAFVNKLAILAEDLNHHPDIKIFNYKYVEISISTHSENKITSRDYELAELIENIIL